MSDHDCLIWSNEHGAWWRPGKQGYTSNLDLAGRYPRQEAIEICSDAIPGTASRLGRSPELPVRASDVMAMVAEYDRELPDRSKPERWE